MPVEVVDHLTKIWKPHARQEEFLRVPDSIFEGLYGGAAGGGKSELILMLPIAREFYKHPKFKGIIFRRTFPQLEESLIPRSHEFYPLVGGVYDAQKHVWRFPESGATIRFSYLDKDSDANSHDTAEYNYAAFDELTHFTRHMYTYITSRVRTSSSGVPAIVRSASNPGNIGHVWVRDRFVEKARLGRRILYDPESNSKLIFIPAKLTDNPYLMKTDPNYGNRLRLLGEAERKAKLDGDWWIFAGQVFTEWREFKMGDEPDNACHVIEPFLIPSWWPKVLAIDWGYTAMTWAGWAALAPDARIFMYREFTAKKRSIPEWGADIARLCRLDENIVDIEIDPSANQKRGEKSIKEQFIEASGLVPNDADNDRVSGKMLLHDMLRWTPRPPKYIPQEGYLHETAMRILRMHGELAMDEYRNMFEPEPEEKNIPRLQIFNTCRSFIDTIPTCVYDEKKVEDVKEFNGDDPYDGGRYLLKAIDRYLKTCRVEAGLRTRRAEIINRLQETGDQTTFYREMRRYDSESKPVVSVARRYQGVRNAGRSQGFAYNGRRA